MHKIGPYEIAGLLATGGMAEILLGRRVGPSGFEREVVIKRILSRLAKDSSYVSMFIDEARIAARIHHPNVVQVFDLLIEDTLLCIIMEYLKGETLASLFRRASARKMELEPEICSYIIAEAAAGLHAAHELVDQNNKPVGLVHRDISPQNIFATYDGSVKILDFGIAKARDRFTHTQTGQLKGNYAYMSPEQCASEKLDRRSDIFSLGTILYELTTNHRLFRRPNQFLILKAIVDSAIAPPSVIKPDYPKRLEEICLHALAKDKHERYQTAGELRHDLLTTVSNSKVKGLPEVRLSALMQELFVDRMEEKEDLLYNLRHGLDISHLPPPETDLAEEIPTATEEILPLKTEDLIVDVPPVEPTVPSTRRIWQSLAVVVVLLVAATVVSIVFFLEASIFPPIRTQATRDPGVSEMRSPDKTPEKSQLPSPREIVLNIETTPSGAQVYIDDVMRGATPTKLELPSAKARIELKVLLEGYVPVKMSLLPEANQHLELTLVEDIFVGGIEQIDSGTEPDGGESSLDEDRQRRWRRRWLRNQRLRQKREEENPSKYRRFD